LCVSFIPPEWIDNQIYTLTWYKLGTYLLGTGYGW